MKNSVGTMHVETTRARTNLHVVALIVDLITWAAYSSCEPLTSGSLTMRARLRSRSASEREASSRKPTTFRSYAGSKSR